MDKDLEKCFHVLSNDQYELFMSPTPVAAIFFCVSEISFFIVYFLHHLNIFSKFIIMTYLVG